MTRSTPIRIALLFTSLWVALLANPLDAQDYSARLGTVQRGGKVPLNRRARECSLTPSTAVQH